MLYREVEKTIKDHSTQLEEKTNYEYVNNQIALAKLEGGGS